MVTVSRQAQERRVAQKNTELSNLPLTKGQMESLLEYSKVLVENLEANVIQDVLNDLTPSDNQMRAQARKRFSAVDLYEAMLRFMSQ